MFEVEVIIYVYKIFLMFVKTLVVLHKLRLPISNVILHLLSFSFLERDNKFLIKTVLWVELF